VTALLMALAILVPNPGKVCDHTRRHHSTPHVHGRTLKRWKRTVAPFNAHLTRIAWCESRLRWTISTGNGYYGGLQFSLASWRAVGGSGYPHHASPLEQKYRAVRLSRLQGWGAWPVCGRS
jgi:hypothetical protein